MIGQCWETVRFRCRIKERFLWVLIVLLLMTGCQGGSIEAPGSQEAAEFIAIYVSEAGVYELSPEVIRAAGWGEEELASLRITNRGEEVGYWIAERGGKPRILFWGEEYHSRYTRDNVYRIDVNHETSGNQVTRISIDSIVGAPDNSPFSEVSNLLMLEQNLLYTPQITDGYPFVWEKMTAPAKKQIEFTLDQIADGSGSIQVNLWASTGAETPAEKKKWDHHIIIRLNGNIIVDELFSGKGRRVIGGVIQAGALKNGENVLELELPGDSRSLVDILQLDWIEIGYQRNLLFSNEILFFSGSGGTLAAGFGKDSGGVVLDISKPNAPQIINEEISQGISFETGIDSRYVYAPESAWVSQPKFRIGFEQVDLRDSGIQADYLVLGEAELLPGVDPLLEHRRSQGYSPKAIQLEWVFDQFSFGIFDPQAIRDFLRFAFKNWNIPPKYVLLLGDFTYDPGGLLFAPPENMLPGFFVQTEYGGETISDAALVILDGSGLPDIALGRIPGTSASEIRGVAKKIIEYESRLPAFAAESRLLVIADTEEARFLYDAQEFAGWFKGTLSSDIYDPEDEVQEQPDNLHGFFVEAYLLIAYFGHGSLSQWGKEAIFSSDAAAKLTNRNQLPVVINLTCLTGYYIHPKARSIAENLLMNQAGGAIAMLAPSSLTLPDDQRAFSMPLAEAFAEDPRMLLGELFLRAQRSLPVDRSGTRDVLLTYMLFGDPALRLPAFPVPEIP